jgi:hypothetical protein
LAPQHASRSRLFAWLLGCCWLLASATALTDRYDERRLRTGARLLRSLLAADLGLEQKAATRGERITVWVYGGDERLQRELALLIAPRHVQASAIRGLPVEVRGVSGMPQMAHDITAAPAPISVFLASAPAAADVQLLIDWSRTHGVILFSPFEGHVEVGVASGLAIGAKVQPYLNSAALREAGIQLKPFFLRVAKVLP